MKQIIVLRNEAHPIGMESLLRRDSFAIYRDSVVNFRDSAAQRKHSCLFQLGKKAKSLPLSYLYPSSTQRSLWTTRYIPSNGEAESNHFSDWRRARKDHSNDFTSGEIPPVGVYFTQNPNRRNNHAQQQTN